jgi:hypothetical protein
MNSNNKRTIIQNMYSLQYYQFEYLDDILLSTIESVIVPFSSSSRERAYLVLKLFECFLQVSGQNKQVFQSTHLGLVIKPFVGALWSDTFLSATNSSRYALTRIFFAILMALKSEYPDLIILTVDMKKNHSNMDWEEHSPDIQDCINAFSKLSLRDERIYYWRGWWILNKTNMPWFVPLIGVYKCYGREFTERVFFQLSTAYLKCRRSMNHGVSAFCQWLPLSGYPLAQFHHPEAVEQLFQKFLIYYMSVGYNNSNGSSVRSLIKRWRGFITFVENNLLGSIFAEPVVKLIAPAPATIKGSEMRIKLMADGVAVKEKLLTDVPLQITDEQAIELLFKQIQADFDHIVAVATKMASDLWTRYQRRKMLAPLGKVKPIKGTVAMSEKERQWIIHGNNPDWLANACATFESKNFDFDSNGRPLVASSYSLPSSEIVHALGLPKAFSLIPYMVLLVAEHPKIVASFLTDFELYNKHGKLTGFVELDGVWVLDGRKRRRGVANAQQIVALTINSKPWIEQLIAITDCVRQVLKAKGDDNWRYLFLTCGRGLKPEKMCSQYAQARKVALNGSFFEVLRQSSDEITSEHASKLSSRFDLGSLRASKGVLVYLETRSTKAMSEALGHKEYSSKTLSHYLPTSILDFFQSRWIRIFQQGMIAEAMKDSPLLLEATEFNTIGEFHEFMQNHALKKIPHHLVDPYDDFKLPESKATTDEVVFNINTTILTLLLSIQQAVLHAKKRVCGKASYWSGIAEHLVSQIENGSDHGAGKEFRCHLNDARQRANPGSMERIIYG